MKAIGLDIGTTSVCGILTDAKTGEILQVCTRPNDTFLPTEQPFQKQQDPIRLLAILEGILEELLATADRVVSIGITGQMHGIVYLNAKGDPVGPLTIWQDGRGDQPFCDGLTYAGYMQKKTGHPLATGYGAVTYFYDFKNGLVPETAVQFCTIHDLAAMKLGGRTTPLVHPSDAASLGLFDLKNNCYDTVAIATLGLDVSMFPAVADGFVSAGCYHDIPVSVAIGDNQASVIGSVADLEHSLLVNVGTGSQISATTDRPPNDSSLDCRPLTSGCFLLAGSSLCGGRAYAQLERLFREIAGTVTGTEVKSAYPAMDRLMADVMALPNPLSVQTTFSGTRNQPTLRGGITNIGTDNLTMAALCDGFMNGMVAELAECYTAMRPYLPTKKTILIGSGNGLRYNLPLRRRFEQAFGLPMMIPAGKEEAAFGAALFGMVAAGVYPDLAAAQKLIQYEENEGHEA